MNLCVHDLVEFTGGRLRLAAMPPRDGEFTSFRRILLSPDLVSTGDIYWCLARQNCDPELAYFRGALGVVSSGPPVEPWPGCFSISVADPVAALARFIDRCRRKTNEPSVHGNMPIFPASQESGDIPLELKVLQLCAAQRVDIYPLACGRSPKGHRDRRCRRQAA